MFFFHIKINMCGLRISWCVYMYIWVCMWLEARGWYRVSFFFSCFPPLFFFFETVSFIEPKSQQFSYVSWSVGSRDSPVSSNSPVVTNTWCHIQIFIQVLGIRTQTLMLAHSKYFIPRMVKSDLMIRVYSASLWSWLRLSRWKCEHDKLNFCLVLASWEQPCPRNFLNRMRERWASLGPPVSCCFDCTVLRTACWQPWLNILPVLWLLTCVRCCFYWLFTWQDCHSRVQDPFEWTFPSECMHYLSYQGGSFLFFFKALEVLVIWIIIVITERFGKKRKLLSRNRVVSLNLVK